MTHIYRTTSANRLDKNSFAYKLYQKAKKFGIWNPEDIDLKKDHTDWNNLNEIEKDELEEEMFLTTFLFEEAKHTEFFSRFLDEVAENKTDLTKYHSENYKALFYHELPIAMNNLRNDNSNKALVNASTTYNMIVEGILAETGYHAYFSMLKRNGIMPGMQEGISLLKRDESRHIAYGVYLLAKLIKSDSSLFEFIEERMNSLLPLALGIINEIFESYDEMPFGLQIDDFVSFAMDQFNKRFEKLEKAKTGILDFNEE